MKGDEEERSEKNFEREKLEGIQAQLINELEDIAKKFSISAL